jgi:hypothetical protein
VVDKFPSHLLAQALRLTAPLRLQHLAQVDHQLSVGAVGRLSVPKAAQASRESNRFSPEGSVVPSGIE